MSAYGNTLAHPLSLLCHQATSWPIKDRSRSESSGILACEFPTEGPDVCAPRHQALALIIFQTASGLTGISRCLTPKGDNASTIAFTIAGVAPMVPASPTPLTPSGFTGDGVSVRSSSNHGIIAAFGNA